MTRADASDQGSAARALNRDFFRNVKDVSVAADFVGAGRHKDDASRRSRGDDVGDGLSVVGGVVSDGAGLLDVIDAVFRRQFPPGAVFGLHFQVVTGRGVDSAIKSAASVAGNVESRDGEKILICRYRSLPDGRTGGNRCGSR